MRGTLAKEAAKRVLLLERAPEDEAGGNSRFTAGLPASSTTAPRIWVG